LPTHLYDIFAGYALFLFILSIFYLYNFARRLRPHIIAAILAIQYRLEFIIIIIAKNFYRNLINMN